VFGPGLAPVERRLAYFSKVLSYRRTATEGGGD
jgi:hypothetical protein